MSANKEKKHTIIVADDSRSARTMIANRLEKMGYTVFQAEDGKVAYQLFVKEMPDLILMDANMPVVDGYRTSAEIRRHARGEDARIIMVTGQGDDASVERAFQSGADEFITKPVHWAVLEKRIQLMIERNHNQIAIRENSARMEAVFNTVVDGILVVNDKGMIETLNHASARIFGYWDWELTGKNVSLLMPPREGEKQDAFFQGCLMSGEKNVTGKLREVEGKHKEGHLFPVELSVTEVKLADRVVFTGVVRDITQRKEAEQRIYHQANYDALTDLPNRSLFMKNLADKLAETQKKGGSLALIFIDLDRFKWVNDNLGHPAGDELLKAASARVKALVGEKDAVARLGGDEFTATVTQFKDPSEIETLAFSLLKALNKAFELEGQEVFISGSLGISLFPQDADDLTTLLKRADEAMYQSKKAGRNAYHFCCGQSLILDKRY
ncbi:MAG: diguanylate cyclase [Magnetococcales bacterium]|nr:diguanylate cyclase [Magnetococcales bacterium]